MKYELLRRPSNVLRVLSIIAAFIASTAAEAELAVDGFRIGQKMKSCPYSSVPMRKDARDSGIACRFPTSSRTLFGALADEVSLAADCSGNVETVLVVGIDAVRAAAGAADEYGPPDGTEVYEKLSVWSWMRGEVQLVIFHHHDDQALSNVILNRYPR